MAVRPKLRMRLGDLLVSEQIITDDQLKQALAYQKKSGLKLGKALIELGFIDEDRMLNFLSQQLGIPFLIYPVFQFPLMRLI